MPGGVDAPAIRGNTKFCFQCGALLAQMAELCPKCGVRQQIGPAHTGKNRLTAALLALFLGGLGAHKFYLGENFMGVIYLLFCWTFIPAIAALVEAIIFLTMSDERFSRKYA